MIKVGDIVNCYWEMDQPVKTKATVSETMKPGDHVKFREIK